MSGVDFGSDTDTISIVHRDRKVEVAPNWVTVYFQICQRFNQIVANITSYSRF